MSKCRECKKGTLKILGRGYYGDTVEVECQNENCKECYEVEPDGLGMGGEELFMAMMMDEMFND